MALQTEMTLNEAQLELLLEPKFSMTLHVFKERTHSSAAARELKLAANKVHYYVKQLANVGLLKQVGKQGKAILYEATASKYLIPKFLISRMETGMPEMLDKMFNSLTMGFKAEVIKMTQETLDQPQFDGEAHYFSLEETDEPRQLTLFEPRFDVHQLKLSSQDYQTLVHKLTEVLKPFKQKANEAAKPCTFTLISFQGDLRL